MPERARDRSVLAAAALAVLTLWTGLGSYGLIEPSDARYAEIAREMWVSGDGLFPRLLGIHHFHKPPLIYWLTDLGYAVFGTDEWGARAALGALGLLLCWITGDFAARHLGRRSLGWAVAFTATTPAVIGAGRMLTTDLLLAVCLALALTGWYDHFSGGGARLARSRFYAGAGLAFLAKGPVAWLLLLLILGPFALLHRHRDGGRRWNVAAGVAGILLLALPWYLAVVLRTPGLLDYFLGGQLGSRFQESGMGHPHPVYYYLIAYPALGLPWLAPALPGWRALRREKATLAVFLAAWALIPPLFFSLPATKLPLYVLPAYPAVALLAAWAVAEAPAGLAAALRTAGILLVVLGTAAALVALHVLSLRGGDLTGAADRRSTLLFLPLAVACLAGGLTALLAAAKRPRRAAAALALVMGFLPAWAFLHGDRLPLRTAKVVGEAAAEELGPDDLLVEYRDLSAGLAFYAGRLPLLTGIERETAFEADGGASRLLSTEDFFQLWSGPRRVLVFTRAVRAGELPGARELARGSGYVLLENR